MLIELAERLEATIHRINGHWWNRRKRPDARDIRAAIDLTGFRAAVPVGPTQPQEEIAA